MKHIVTVLTLYAVSAAAIAYPANALTEDVKVPVPQTSKTAPALTSGTSVPPSPELQSQSSKSPRPKETTKAASLSLQGPNTKKALVPNHPRQVIKFGDQFMLLDDLGLMPADTQFGYGLYRDDTRYLSTWDVRLNGTPLTMLYKNMEDGYAARYVYGNADCPDLPSEKAMVERTVLINERERERFRVTNFDTIKRKMTLTIRFGSDFADMFEVRGDVRKKVGVTSRPQIDEAANQVLLSYTGLDNRTMKTAVDFARKPDVLTGTQATFSFTLAPHETWSLETAVASNYTDTKSPVDRSMNDSAGTAKAMSMDKEKAAADKAYTDWRASCAAVVTDNDTFNAWVEKSYRDIYILRQPMPKGNGIAAGLPWFAVAFGRDQEVTSLETLPFMPELTRNVLALLAAYQGTKDDEFTQEKPGRIMHELRLGEMARLREIPFIPYYGTVDATPLYLTLLGQYVDTTGDIAFAEKYWDNIERALDFLNRETKDGYLRYGYGKGARLTNIGWKDSGDSVMYGDGHLVDKLPIALCEVQGYLYSGWRSAATLAERLGKQDEAQSLRKKADELQARFSKDFWNPQLGTFVLALDGSNRQCDVVSSNPGHLLFSGILTDEQKATLSERLMQPDMFSGWGVRTLSSNAVAYNPLSYHNGSVWPHDNAIIADGLGIAKRSDLAVKVLNAMFRVAKSEPDLRLPELFCGFTSNYAEQPIWYPVSCSPQAWAAGSVFMMMQGSLGLSIHAADQGLRLTRPQLPEGVSEMEVRGLHIGDKRADLLLKRLPDGVSCELKNANGVKLLSN